MRYMMELVYYKYYDYRDFKQKYVRLYALDWGDDDEECRQFSLMLLGIFRSQLKEFVKSDDYNIENDSTFYRTTISRNTTLTDSKLIQRYPTISEIVEMMDESKKKILVDQGYIIDGN